MLIELDAENPMARSLATVAVPRQGMPQPIMREESLRRIFHFPHPLSDYYYLRLFLYIRV